MKYSLDLPPAGIDRDHAHPAPVRATYTDVLLALLTLVGVFFWVLLLMRM